jgi:hypothetical protein
VFQGLEFADLVLFNVVSDKDELDDAVLEAVAELVYGAVLVAVALVL